MEPTNQGEAAKLSQVIQELTPTLNDYGHLMW
jgi:hypothetical protein